MILIMSSRTESISAKEDRRGKHGSGSAMQKAKYRTNRANRHKGE